MNLQDYIDNFDFSEKCNGLIKFFLWCNADGDMSDIESVLKAVTDYDCENNLPLLELNDEENEY